MSKNFSYKKEKSPAEFGDSGASFNSYSDLSCRSDISSLPFNCITNVIQCQEFADKKILSEFVSDSFMRLSKNYMRSDTSKLLSSDDDNFFIKQSGIFLNRAMRIRSCSSFLQFRVAVSDGLPVGSSRLVSANFCKDRLCPQCAKRLSLKNYSNLSQVLSEVGSEYSMLLLTLTVPNVSGESLSAEIDHLMKSWHKLTNTKQWRSVVKGYFRALEITRNKKTGLFHPHYHCVLVVDSGYFKSRQYISHSEWLDMWRKATNDYSITQVNIKRFRGSNCSESDREFLKRSINEVSKYAVKSSDYVSEDIAFMDSSVEILASALKGRRLVHFGGLLKDIFRRLKLEDAESSSADLVNVDSDIESLSGDVVHLLVTLNWSAGCYKVSDIRRDDS